MEKLLPSSRAANAPSPEKFLNPAAANLGQIDRPRGLVEFLVGDATFLISHGKAPPEQSRRQRAEPGKVPQSGGSEPRSDRSPPRPGRIPCRRRNVPD